MVKVPLRGKGIKHSFREDFGIVVVLGRKDDFIFLGSNSEFSGQGGSVNLFIIE